MVSSAQQQLAGRWRCRVTRWQTSFGTVAGCIFLHAHSIKLIFKVSLQMNGFHYGIFVSLCRYFVLIH